MPTYDYVCSSCNHELEIFQSISSSPKRKCPECGRHTLKRQIGSGAGIIFKGSGFYETDYRSAEYQKAAKADKEAASSSKETSEKATSKKETAGKETSEKPASTRTPAPTDSKTTRGGSTSSS